MPSIWTWWNWKEIGKKVFIAFGAVFPPNQEGIVKDTTVHIDYAVNIVLNKAGCANDHAIGDLMIFTPLLHPAASVPDRTR